ncbi:hypothetical protein BDP27DRAFT_1416766 [Rhodocollybia butyracea]|uniref:Uncharacterized protein n=1 Tax=Rhodocollybia butyracea TaxID=206335 RepID=A0A9P5PWA9_9AGAR|nr:hypothetical protein BDP27DRAFT_1416766 [Rhodocollybia butyracea]
MSLITAIIISTFLEVLVYGLYVATFIRHVQILVLRRKKLPPKTFIYLSTASLLLFVVATITMVADLIFATHILKNHTDYSGYGQKRNIKIVSWFKLAFMAIINVVWWLSTFVTSIISPVVYQVFDASYVCVTALIFSAVIVSASRPPSSESFQVTPISFPAQSFLQDSMPSADSLSVNDMLPGAVVQPVESSSQIK